MSIALPKSTHWVFNHCDDEVKETMRAYWTKKWPRLEKLLKTFPLDVQDVRLTVTCHQPPSHRPWYELHTVLRLPVGTVAADASDKEPPALIDQVVDTLVEEVKRRKERGSKRFLYKRKNRPHASPRTEPGLEHRQDFFAMFRPLLPRLAEHARHELRSLEAKGLLHRGELTVADLLDEMLTRAWRTYGDRPRGVLMETWLATLMHDAIEEWIKQEPHPYRSVDQPVREELPTDEQPQVDDQEWWAWLLGYRDRSTIADLLPDRESSESSAADIAGAEGNVANETAAEEHLPSAASTHEAASREAESTDSADPLDDLDPEVHDQVWLFLRDLPSHEHQALIFNALDGLTPGEIALLQDRPESDVRGDIEAARHTLHDRLLAAEGARTGEEAKRGTRAAAASGSAKPVAAAGSKR